MEDRQLMAVANSIIGLDLGAAIAQVAAGRAANPRLDPALVDLADQVAQGRPADAVLSTTSLPMLSDPFGRVAVTVTASDVNNVLPKLQAFGFSSTFADADLHTIEGYLPITSLTAAAGLGPDGLLGILPSYRPGSAAGSVLSQADYVLEANRVRQTPAVGVNGSGVTVGVLSDSFNSRQGYAADVASGDLPGGVQVVQDTSGSDEGRAMAQLVYDMAPGAGLAFATAFVGGQGGFANNIRALANPSGPNAKVITDDVFYFEEPLFQDGLIAQAINQVASQNDVAYFALAGNLGSNAYESTNFTTAADSFYAGNFYNFNPGGTADTRQRITVAAGQTIILNLQWDNPFFTTNGVTTNLDFYLLNGNTVAAGSAGNNLVSQTPSEIFSYTNNSGAAQALDLAIVLGQGPAPTRIKWVNYGANNYGAVAVNEYNTNSPTVIPHSAAAGGLSVAAAPYFNQLSPESYSSLGPFTAVFNADGTRLSSAQVRQAPDITSIDGTDTTFFGSDADGNNRPNFFGTSAAAPHAAGVAALVRSANPGLSSAQVYSRITSTATDIDSSTSSSPGVASGVDNRTGFGLVDAFRAAYGPATAATLPVRDGFESSALSTNWDTFASGAGRTLVATNNGPAAGSYHLTMDSSINFLGGQNEATLLVNTAGVTSDVLLSFKEKEFNEDENPMPASFTGRSNTDGVAFSVDGNTWHRLVSLTGASSTNSYQTFNYNLSAAARALGLTLGATTRVRFQRFGGGTITGPTNGSIASPTGGIAFDDVRVAAASTVASTVVDDGGSQRSVVRQIVLNVNGVVASAPASAFAIARTQDNAAFTPTVAISYPTATTSRITLTFTGSGTEFGSLPDGDYTLVVNGNQILDDFGAAVDADGDGRVGGMRTVTFFRLFGDSDGDRDVDGTDFNLFRQAYLGQIPLPSYFDFNNNGTVVNDTADRDAFLARRGKRLTTGGVVFA